MIKGTPQSKRGNAWHRKHLKKRTSFNIARIARLSKHRLGGRSLEKAEIQYKKALEYEKLKTVGLWQRILLTLKRLFSFKKLSNA